MRLFILIPLLTVTLNRLSADDQTAAVSLVTGTPGLVAFWDFVKRESDGSGRFLAHVPDKAPNDYPLDAANYIKDYWGEGREATYEDFPLLGRGPFGQAIRIVKESDPDFRPFLLIPRSRLHDTPLDIKGADKSVTVIVWAIRESGNHALAGIWHEGTDLKEKSTTTIARVERGQRQYALFAGLNKAGSACGHVSENGASSFLNKYALHKCNSADLSPEEMATLGAEIYRTQGCAGCHSIDGVTGVGPTWKGLYEHEVELANDTAVIADEAYLKSSILDPASQIVKGFNPVMPATYKDTLTEAQISQLVEYIKSLK